MKILTAKTAMVTGGATGIGAATVERLAMLGADVACCYNTSRVAAESLAQKMQEHGHDIFTVKVDVSNGQEIKAGVEAIAAHFGRSISILVNNAGDVFAASPLDRMEEELWDKVMGVNLRGAFLCAKYCIPGMKTAKAGRIINVTSISARTGGGPGAAHYAASKGGLEALTRAMALELAPFHITVNAVSPGVIDTPIHQRTNTPETLEKLRQVIPLARLGRPEEVARVISFLASEDASYITGDIIAVNGGKRMD
ncbi:MAG: SDR family oxidoreductase [Chloroflexi bacterium]|nr:SDR family oxidoreductase [Chloroflexota bacterium]